MWSSKDIAYVVLFSVLSVVNLATVVQFFAVFVPLPGVAYYVDIVGAILGGVNFLLFEGRRWRIFAKGILIALLTLPLYLGPGAAPFNIVSRIPIIIKMLLVDIIFNSLYGPFKRRNKLHWLAILPVSFFFIVSPFIDLLFASIFVPFELLWLTYSFVAMMLPLIVGLSITGGYIGYRIYKRVEKIT
jgi:hypothetical protein